MTCVPVAIVALVITTLPILRRLGATSGPTSMGVTTSSRSFTLPLHIGEVLDTLTPSWQGIAGLRVVLRLRLSEEHLGELQESGYLRRYDTGLRSCASFFWAELRAAVRVSGVFSTGFGPQPVVDHLLLHAFEVFAHVREVFFAVAAKHSKRPVTCVVEDVADLRVSTVELLRELQPRFDLHAKLKAAHLSRVPAQRVGAAERLSRLVRLVDDERVICPSTLPPPVARS